MNKTVIFAIKLYMSLFIVGLTCCMTSSLLFVFIWNNSAICDIVGHLRKHVEFKVAQPSVCMCVCLHSNALKYDNIFPVFISFLTQRQLDYIGIFFLIVQLVCVHTTMKLFTLLFPYHVSSYVIRVYGYVFLYFQHDKFKYIMQ